MVCVKLLYFARSACLLMLYHICMANFYPKLCIINVINIMEFFYQKFEWSSKLHRDCFCVRLASTLIYCLEVILVHEAFVLFDYLQYVLFNRNSYFSHTDSDFIILGLVFKKLQHVLLTMNLSTRGYSSQISSPQSQMCMCFAEGQNEHGEWLACSEDFIFAVHFFFFFNEA